MRKLFLMLFVVLLVSTLSSSVYARTRMWTFWTIYRVHQGEGRALNFLLENSVATERRSSVVRATTIGPAIMGEVTVGMTSRTVMSYNTVWRSANIDTRIVNSSDHWVWNSGFIVFNEI